MFGHCVWPNSWFWRKYSPKKRPCLSIKKSFFGLAGACSKQQLWVGVGWEHGQQALALVLLVLVLARAQVRAHRFLSEHWHHHRHQQPTPTTRKIGRAFEMRFQKCHANEKIAKFSTNGNPEKSLGGFFIDWLSFMSCRFLGLLLLCRLLFCCLQKMETRKFAFCHLT